LREREKGSRERAVERDTVRERKRVLGKALVFADRTHIFLLHIPFCEPINFLLTE
jgi:hypothetical protein